MFWGGWVHSKMYATQLKLKRTSVTYLLARIEKRAFYSNLHVMPVSSLVEYGPVPLITVP